jgi:hypothetical protein
MEVFKKNIILTIIIFSSALDGHTQPAFDKVVIWAYKLHSHTHSYIHDAFYKAFQHLGYDTYWFDDNDDVTNFDFNKCLFVTMGGTDNLKMPLIETSYYLLHNCIYDRFKELYENGHAITFQVYTHRCKNQHDDIKKIDACIYGSKSGKTLYMPWATDLLPHQIEEIQKRVTQNWGNAKEKAVYWVGSIYGGYHGNQEQINSFKKSCITSNVAFNHRFSLSPQENCELILRSYCAPTIVGAWQNEEGYIPCRAFKNASYGQYLVTNSKTVFDLFEGRGVYNKDTKKLFYDAEKKLRQLKLSELLELMDFIKTKHTYINRIQLLLSFLEECSHED